MKQQTLYVIILAGGKGERLWPLSREKKPKQLLTLTDSQTLVQLTIDRVKQMTTKDALWVMTTNEYKDALASLVKDTVGTIMTEPATRNTAPAILLTCLHIAKQDPHAIVIFLPADHYIPDAHALRDALTKAAAYAHIHNKIVLLGNKPTFAATGYGYIEYDMAHGQDGIYTITQFHEKPDALTAQHYITMPNMLWNGGMFVGTVATFIAEFRQYAPQLYQQVHDFCAGKLNYADVTSISIDHAVMEHSHNIAVLPVDFVWSDIGNLRIFLELQQTHGHLQQQLVSYKSSNNLVSVASKLVALVGVENLCIVETDDVLLIGDAHAIEHVKQIVQILKKDGKYEYL